MTDAPGAIISQLIFFLAVAWASVLAPVLFGERLRSLEEAAKKAGATYAGIQDTLAKSVQRADTAYDSIQKKLEASTASAEETFRKVEKQLKDGVDESRRQFAHITVLQKMAQGHAINEQHFADLEPDQRIAFLKNAWEKAKPLVTESIQRLDGRTRRAISDCGRYRSQTWWDRVAVANALGDRHSDFRLVSSGRDAAQGNGANIADQLLKDVNAALNRIMDANDNTAPAAQLVPDVVAGGPAAEAAIQPNPSI